MSYGIIYKVTNTTSGKVYIGQTTKTLAKRKGNHAYRAKMGDCRYPFGVAILEHGINAFHWEQIDAAETAGELDRKEKQWIAYYKSDDPQFGYNTFEGGKNQKHTAETKQKISEANRGEKHYMFGKHLSTETRLKLSKIRKGLLAGEKNPGAKLSEADVREIKIALSNKESCTSLAKKFNTSIVTISDIKRGATWAWLQIGA